MTPTPPKPLSNAERQAKYRSKRANAGSFGRPGERFVRIDMWIPGRVKSDLACLAALHGAESLQAELIQIIQTATAEARKADPKAWAEALDRMLQGNDCSR